MTIGSEGPGTKPGSEEDEAAAEVPAADVDPEAVRRFHRRFPTGVTVVTAMHDGEPRGLAVNAFASVSLEPPVVMVCVANQSATAPALHGSDHIAINVLAADQIEIARRFATSGGDKFTGVAWRPGQTGAPVLESTAAHLEAVIEQRIPAYTHTIFLARVVAAAASDREPMIYLDGHFHGTPTLG